MTTETLERNYGHHHPDYMKDAADALSRGRTGRLNRWPFRWSNEVRFGKSCAKPLEFLVGVAGFEPATPSSRTKCATRLRYTPT